MTNYTIIGSGAAGIAAAGAVRREDPQGTIRVFTNDPDGYYSRPGLAYLLTGEIPRAQLFPFSKDYFRNLNIQLVSQPVQSLNPQAHQLATVDGRSHSFDRLLLATGATAAMPKTPGIDLAGVVKLDSLEDADWILKNARKARTAVVVGGGITALELAEGLAACGLKVHYFLRAERYWSAVLDEVESRIIESRLAHEGIKIHYFTDLIEIYGRGGRVAGVLAEEQGQKIDLPCQIVAVAIGIKPRIDLALQAGLNTQRGVIVDASLRTSHPDIFAAGDTAQVFDPLSGEYVVDSLWYPAIEQGWTAGLNMTGASHQYIKKYPFNVTRLGGLVTTIIGRVGRDSRDPGKPRGDADVSAIMRGDSEIWRMRPEAMVAQTYHSDNRLRLYVGPSSLAGAVVMGDQTLSRPLQHLIRNQVDISVIRETLLSQYNSLAATLSNFWDTYRHTHAAEIS